MEMHFKTVGELQAYIETNNIDQDNYSLRTNEKGFFIKEKPE